MQWNLTDEDWTEEELLVRMNLLYRGAAAHTTLVNGTCRCEVLQAAEQLLNDCIDTHAHLCAHAYIKGE